MIGAQCSDSRQAGPRRLRLPRGLIASGLCGLLAAAACTPPLRGADPHLAQGGSGFGQIAGVPDAKPWLLEDSARARSAGAGATQVLKVEAAAPGDKVSAMLSLPTKDCALVVARSTSSVEDVDLYAYGEDGSVLGADEGPDAKPTLMVCPPHPARIFVVARVAAGHGMVALGAQRVDPSRAEEVGQRSGAHGRPGEAAGRAEVWPGLDQHVALHRRQLGGGWQDLRKVALPIESRIATRLSSVVEENRCLDALVVPSEEASHLDVAVLDDLGRIIGRAGAIGKDRSIVICSPVKLTVTIEVRPHAGRGLAAIVLGRSIAGTESDLRGDVIKYEAAPLGDLKDVRDRSEQRLEARGYQQAKVLGQGEVSVGQQSSIAVEMSSGCTRLDVLSGRPVRGIEAWLWSEAGDLLANERSNGQLALFVCSAGGKARLDLQAVTQPGPFAVEARTERAAPSVLSTQPLAASRLLSRMVERGVIYNASQASGAKLVALDSEHLAREDLLVPVGRCIDVTAALGGGMSGVDLRLLQRSNGETLASASGTVSASARVCALESGRSIDATIEIRPVAGHGSGLVATRMLAPKP